MTEIPSIWRAELWHPLTVHFPVALLIVATLARLAGRFLWSQRNWLLKMSRVLLYAGTLFAWIAVYTGNLADSEVVRSLCDPTVVEAHENLSYRLGWIFTVAALLDLTGFLPLPDFGSLWQYTKEWIIILLLLIGTGYLGYSAHLGAKLVYQQGAGVYHPTEQCTEFE